MNTLSIDSSTKRLSIAASRNERLLSEITADDSTNHMVSIMGMLDRVLVKSKLTLEQIDVFGVNSGPGDFTGTRIGISIIKILSLLENKLAYGIDSLDAIAVGMGLRNTGFIAKALGKNSSVILMPCIDVKREEVYFAFYNVTAREPIPVGRLQETEGKNSYIARVTGQRVRYTIKKTGENFLMRHDSLENFLGKLTGGGAFKIPGVAAEYLNPEVLIGGNCYLSYGRIISDIVKKGKIFTLDKKTAFPHAEYINICSYYNALKKAEAKNIVPVYVRDFIPFGGR
ncbi:MAG: tRNA (adenosine(37)-N6)-threonylcarbamoyltransferase complex dimerization subunit type 1 TsaB [Actinomycetota bacterium]|nr:tRNA (adenosine(37)-N6)-threonylcarbamoyltransferase complex dimerization subunit type 1 TsaB [Actinomycetota bacterium]